MAETIVRQAEEWCGCGEPIIMYDGEWLHLYSPEVTGAYDHNARPASEIGQAA
jgi:hypothetical protein